MYKVHFRCCSEWNFARAKFFRATSLPSMQRHAQSQFCTRDLFVQRWNLPIIRIWQPVSEMSNRLRLFLAKGALRVHFKGACSCIVFDRFLGSSLFFNHNRDTGNFKIRYSLMLSKISYKSIACEHSHIHTYYFSCCQLYCIVLCTYYVHCQWITLVHVFPCELLFQKIVREQFLLASTGFLAKVIAFFVYRYVISCI